MKSAMKSAAKSAAFPPNRSAAQAAGQTFSPAEGMPVQAPKMEGRPGPFSPAAALCRSALPRRRGVQNLRVWELAFLALAAPEALAEGSAFSAKAIFFQVFNFSIFFALLVWLARKPIKAFLAKEREDFLSFERQAREREKDLGKSLDLWRKKLADLKSREKTIQEKAEKEGRLFLAEKKNLLQETEEQMEREAAFLLRLESEKGRREIFRAGKKQIAARAEALLKAEAGQGRQKFPAADLFKQLRHKHFSPAKKTAAKENLQ